jgi:hypothetical protein
MDNAGHKKDVGSVKLPTPTTGLSQDLLPRHRRVAVLGELLNVVVFGSSELAQYFSGWQFNEVVDNYQIIC